MWKKCNDFEAYCVSASGEVKNNRGRLLKQRKDKDGYLHVNLRRGGKEYCVFVHRLVAMAHVNNAENKPQVNHIDGNKSNNAASNLEWVTCSENNKHKYAMLGMKQHNRKKVVCIETGEVFETLEDAAKKYNVHSSGISTAIRHPDRQKTAAKMHWKFAEIGSVAL